jgi:hypothetical protein
MDCGSIETGPSACKMVNLVTGYVRYADLTQDDVGEASVLLHDVAVSKDRLEALSIGGGNLRAYAAASREHSAEIPRDPIVRIHPLASSLCQPLPAFRS